MKNIDETYYLRVHRYTMSAFLRLKLGKELGERQLSLRNYETVEQARQNQPAE